MIAPDPDFLAIVASDQEEEAWQELQDRRDRMNEHGPAGCSGLTLPSSALRAGLTARSAAPPATTAGLPPWAGRLSGPTSMAPRPVEGQGAPPKEA